MLKELECHPSKEELVEGYGTAGEQPEHLQAGGDALADLSVHVGSHH
jgi:hypothetical protein